MCASPTLEIGFDTLDGLFADGFEDLAAAHWQEVALHKDIAPLNPDYARMRWLEKQGFWRAIGARLDGELVGYTTWFIARSMNYGSLYQADNHLIYLDPDARGGWRGVRLVTDSERLLKTLGVNYARYHTKLHVEADRGTVAKVLERAGYVLEERIHGKILE